MSKKEEKTKQKINKFKDTSLASDLSVQEGQKHKITNPSDSKDFEMKIGQKQKEAISSVASPSRPEIKQKPKAKKKSAPKMLTLIEVARQHVKNYKEHWQPSIESFAKSQGFQSPATKEDCLNLLKKWGAQLV